MVESIIDFSIRNKFIILIISFILGIASIWSVKNTSLDALPDLSPAQVIIQIKWDGQSPKLIEEQISYPLISNLLSLQNIETVRAMSSFQNGLVYIIFKDGTDLYEARTRVLEKLSQLNNTFPEKAKINIGPDATGVGWVYEYALTSENKSLAELRTLQDYYYKYALLAVDGVSDVASIGGFIKTFEISIDSTKLQEFNLSLKDIQKAINSNDKGGGLILSKGYENIIQGKGYLKSLDDIKNISIKTIGNTPLLLKDIATIRNSSLNRRGMADLNGEGETVGGIVIVRYGENPYQVIKNVKAKLKTLNIKDVKIIETYDRSSLIDKAIDTLKHTLIEESIIVVLITILFLFHFRSSIIILLTLPLTVGYTFLCMKLFGLGSNIMSLGGIAIAIGAMVDATIVMVENAHKAINKTKDNLNRELTEKERQDIIISSSKKVGRPIFFALILVVVSFLPIFALTGQEGKLFGPLAFTKTFAMLSGAIISITIVPIFMMIFIKGKILKEEKNYLSIFFNFIYSPLLKMSIKIRYLIVIAALALITYTVPVYKNLKWEFMPMLNEQTFMYMPVTPYGIGIDLAKDLTQETDKIIKSIPEVKNVFGKAGRADTATDPAPLAMIESIIILKDESEWRKGMTYQKIMKELDSKLQIPGLINSWTYPIRGRIDMLLTGIRTPLGIKVYGNNNQKLEEVSTKIELKLKELKETLSVSSDKSNSGYYLDININESNLARYGITKNDILNNISAINGNKISEIIEGLERYPILIKYSDNDKYNLENLHIKTKLGFFPLKEFANIKYTEGPSIIKSEKGMKVSFIYITPHNKVSSKEYKEKAKSILKNISLPQGYYIEWAGQSEYLESAMNKLFYIIPLTLLIIFILIYFSLRNIFYTTIIFFSLPFAISGGILYIDYLNFNMSIAVIVGFLALLGVAAETSIVMMIYLDDALKENKDNLFKAVYRGATLRLRPKLMTLFAILGGLIPIMYINGVGSEVMQRIAAPMIGGMITSSILTLIIIPIVFYIIKDKIIKNQY